MVIQLRKGKAKNFFTWNPKREGKCLIMHCVFILNHCNIVSATVNVSVSIKPCFYLRLNMYREWSTTAPFVSGAVTGRIKVQESGIDPVPQRKY